MDFIAIGNDWEHGSSCTQCRAKVVCGQSGVVGQTDSSSYSQQLTTGKGRQQARECPGDDGGDDDGSGLHWRGTVACLGPDEPDDGEADCLGYRPDCGPMAAAQTAGAAS
jgi:hypothetical protein